MLLHAQIWSIIKKEIQMAVLSRVNYGAIELLQVDSDPNGTSSLTNSLAILTTDNSVYKNAGGTTWVLLAQNSTTINNKSFATSTSKFLGSAYAETGAMGGEFGATITTTTPIDDTIPQYTEGKVILTSPVYTVKSNTSKILVSVTVNGSTSSIASYTIHTHRSDNGASYTANAEASSYMACMVNTSIVPHSLIYSVNSPGANTTIQYAVVTGPNGGTLTINGLSGARYFGGKYLSTILVQEFEQ